MIAKKEVTLYTDAPYAYGNEITLDLKFTNVYGEKKLINFNVSPID